jgi:hypothetical protein
MCGSSVPLAESRAAAPDRGPEIHLATEAGLRQSGYLALHAVACDSRGEVVYLRGRVPSYYLKQVAQAIAGRVKGVARVVNLIEVLTPERRGAGGPGCRRAGAAPVE